LKLFCSISQLHVVPIIGWVTVIGSVTLYAEWQQKVIWRHLPTQNNRSLFSRLIN